MISFQVYQIRFVVRLVVQQWGLFGALTGDGQLVHTKVEFTTPTIFGERILHRLSILAIGGGIRLRADDQTVPRSAIALYELDKARFVVLTEISDTIHVETEVVQLGGRDEPYRIIVGHRSANQGGGSVRRVAITGRGIVSVIGNNAQEVLASLQHGRSGIEFIPERKAMGFRSALGGRIKSLPPLNIPKRNLRQMGPGSMFAVHAAQQALEDAGLEASQLRSDRVGVVMGNMVNAQDTYRQCRLFHDKTLKLGGTAMQRAMTDSVSANLSVLLGTRGYALTVSAACATGAMAIGLASQFIRWGLQDLCIGGGTSEDGWESVCHFDALQAFSMREDEPTKASRPFDTYRDGLVPSTGAGVVVLEELEHARQRGARIYAELLSFASNSDGYDMTIPSGEGSVRCLELALKDAELAADQVDYINAHASSTPVGDVAEAQAIAKVFGNKPYVSSTKSMTGHELGAAGSNELIYCLLMMEHDFIAPNINIEAIDPQCAGINLLANQAREARIDVAASNSFGFGGVNTCIVLKRYAS